MAKIVIADITETKSDETFYVGRSSIYQKHFEDETLEKVHQKLLKAGFKKHSWIERADGIRVHWWSDGDTDLAVWDNEVQPYKYL
jgi:hypothetical protein